MTKNFREIKKLIGDKCFMIGYKCASEEISIITVNDDYTTGYYVTNHVAKKLNNVSSPITDNRFWRQLD